MNQTKGNAGNKNAGQKRSGKAISTREIKYEECDDIFLGEKGRKLRNLRKKVEKLNEISKAVRESGAKATETQKE